MKKPLSLILILALTLSLGVTAFADNSTKNVTLYYREIKIVIDGRTINPTDATGKAVEPFIYDGTTYLPVRAVADALGLSVAWDDPSSTVTLTSGGEIVDRPGTPAASKGEKAAAITYRDIKIVIDGQTIEPTDAAGKAVEPFIYDGTTYLPVRAIGNALGLAVAWEDATSTVGLTSPDDYLISRETYTYTYEYDGIRESTCYTTDYRYDTHGQIIEERTYEGDELHIGTYTYDSMGWLLSITYSDGTFYRYEHSADGSTTTEFYGLGDEVWSTSVYSSSVDPDSGNTTFTSVSTSEDGSTYTAVCIYNADGNILYLKSSGSDGYFNQMEFVYDTHGNLLCETHFDEEGLYFSCEYTNEYDSKGLLTSRMSVDSEGATVLTSYSYDSNGNLVKMVEDYDGFISTTTYTYRLGLLVEGRVESDGYSYVFEYEYVPFCYGD